MATDGVGGDGWVRYGVGGMCACRFRVGNAEVEDYWIETGRKKCFKGVSLPGSAVG